MNNTELNTLFEKHPVLEEIAVRLDASQKEVNEKNSKLSETDKQNHKKVSVPEHSRVTHWKMHKDNVWSETVLMAKPGRDGLEEQLKHIIKTRNPDVLRISIYKGYGKRGATPLSNQEIKINEAPADLSGVTELKREIDELKNRSSEPESELKKQYNDLLKRLEEREWNDKIDKINRSHEEEKNTLLNKVAALETEIEELKDEVLDSEEGLKGVQDELKTVTDPPFVTMLTKIAEKALEGAAIRNPEFLEKVCKLDKETVQQMLEDINGREKEVTDKEKQPDNSGFTEAADEFEGLEEKHKTAIKELIGLFKQVSFAEFGPLYLVCSGLQKEDGNIDQEKAAKVVEYVKSINIKTQ